jgi:Ca2+-binding RTX toxin-like protein
VRTSVELLQSRAVDRINARGGNDTIVGSAGADTIDGGAGLDLLRYNPSSVSASLSKKDAGKIFVRRGSETDTLINVERLQFTDQWVAIDLLGRFTFHLLPLSMTVKALAALNRYLTSRFAQVVMDYSRRWL